MKIPQADIKLLASNLRRFKIITFDCTNTLFYFKSPPEIQYLKTASSFGLANHFDADLMKENFRKQFKELNEKHPNFGRHTISHKDWWKELVINVFKKSSRDEIDEKFLEQLEPVALKLIDQYRTKECWGKFEKTDELISALKDIGKTVGVIANQDPRLHDLLADMELPKLDFVVTSYEAGIEKPRTEIFREAIKASRQNCSANEALHIGNELNKDYEGAKSSGWSSVLINSDAGDSVEPSFKNIQEFWNIITTKEIKL